jgi:hypothetical protein
MAFAYYDTMTDKRIIKKMVTSGQIALAYIKEGRFVRFIRDAKLNKFMYCGKWTSLYMIKICKLIILR